MSTRTLQDFDPKGVDFMNDPYPFYALARERNDAVYHDARHDIWFVTRYDVAQQVLRDPVLFTSSVDRRAMRSGGWPAEAEAIRANAMPRILTITQNDDPATHAMFRSLVSPFFLPKTLARVDAFVRARTDALLDAIIDKGGRCNFLTDFAVPLPISVIGEYLGVADAGYDTLKSWSDAFADELGLLASDARAIEIAHATVAWQTFLLETIAARRASSRDDIVSHLANAKVDGDRPLTNVEIYSITTQLLLAGNDTTTHTMAGGMRRLAQDPDLFQFLKDEPKRIGAFIEETLRLESPVQGQFRRATADCDLMGVAIPKGALLHVRLASANRDEAVYGQDADRLNLVGRPPKPHMAFGMGMHFCVGAMLSRFEMQIAFQRIAERVEAIALEVEACDLRYNTHFHLRGLKELPIIVRARVEG